MVMKLFTIEIEILSDNYTSFNEKHIVTLYNRH